MRTSLRAEGQRGTALLMTLLLWTRTTKMRKMRYGGLAVGSASVCQIAYCDFVCTS